MMLLVYLMNMECVNFCIFFKDLLAAPVRPLSSVPEMQVLSTAKRSARDTRSNCFFGQDINQV